MVTVTTYKDWTVNDVINICASIDEFCGEQYQYIFANDINVTKSPDACSLQFGTEGGCGLHLNNVELTFKLVKCCDGSVAEKSCNPVQIYKTIGSARTNSNGAAVLVYTVTNQDRLDYENTSGSGYDYKVMACITDADGNPTQISNISRATYPITVASYINLCAGVVCTDQCISNQFWSTKCVPSTGLCIQDTLLFPTCPTHYIEYDFSILPSDFLDLVSTYITDISNSLGAYVSTLVSGNIVYIGSRYIDTEKTFRIYVNYTPSISGLSSFRSSASWSLSSEPLVSGSSISTLDERHRWVYDSSTGRIKALSLISSLEGLGKLLAGILIFFVATRVLQYFGPWGLGISLLVAVIGAVWIVFTVEDLVNNITTSTVAPSDDPHTKIESVDCFVNYLQVQCYNNYGCVPPPTPPPGCTPPEVTPTPPTCSQSSLHDYMVCTGNTRVAQITYNNDQTGKTDTDPSQVNDALLDCIAKLDNGTYTVDQAKECFDTNVTKPADDNTSGAKESTDCSKYGTGYVYDKSTQKCVSTCNVPILGYCADSMILFGGILLGGYVVYRIVSRPRAQQLIVKSEK